MPNAQNVKSIVVEKTNNGFIVRPFDPQNPKNMNNIEINVFIDMGTVTPPADGSPASKTLLGFLATFF